MVPGIKELGLRLVLSSLKVLVLTSVTLDNVYASGVLGRLSGPWDILGCIGVIGLCCMESFPDFCISCFFLPSPGHIAHAFIVALTLWNRNYPFLSVSPIRFLGLLQKNCSQLSGGSAVFPVSSIWWKFSTYLLND